MELVHEPIYKSTTLNLGSKAIYQTNKQTYFSVIRWEDGWIGVVKARQVMVKEEQKIDEGLFMRRKTKAHIETVFFEWRIVDRDIKG